MEKIKKNALLLAITLICVPLFCFFTVLQKTDSDTIKKYLGGMTLEKTLVRPMAFAPVPTANDSFWVNTIPANIREDYIKLGKKYQGQPWEPIPDALFADFKKTGNRKNFETPYFEKRRQMASLVMAEVLEHKGNLLRDIDNGMKYFLSEVWWGIPASYPTDYPDKNNQRVDLFNPETANLLAWTVYMLHDELESIDKGICDKIKEEIRRRVLKSARENGYYWHRSIDNWNPWICSNLISCILFCEPSREQQIHDIELVLDCMDYFITNYPEDGGCDEGIMYWDRAGASFYECAYLLDIATNHSLSFRNNEKLKAIGGYAYKMYIGNRTFVNFADSHPTNRLHINILYPFGKYVNDSVMMKQAAFIAKDEGYFKTPAVSYRASGNYPALSRELMFLALYDSFSKTPAAEPLIRDAEFKDLHIITARTSENSTDGFFVAAKGGHNKENHNHNDVGNFVVYKDAEPLIIDIGVGTYNSKTFSETRYEIFNCRSAYHNVPLINGFEQRQGKEYQAKGYKYKNGRKRVQYSFDLASAYPAEASVDEWKRTIQVNRKGGINVTEKYLLNKYVQPSEITLICCGEARLEGLDEILINNGKNTGVIHFDSEQLTPTIEKISYQDNAIFNVWQKRDLYRITLTIKSHKLKGKVSYSIQ